MAGYKTNSGENLRRKWDIPVKKARYHKDGSFYMPLGEFPGALCDPSGYVMFKTKKEYESSSYLRHGNGTRLNVNDISRMPNYQRMEW